MPRTPRLHPSSLTAGVRVIWCSPPNTLFRLRDVLAPGTWQAPGGVYPRQRLLVVSATYVSCSGSPAAGNGSAAAKMGGGMPPKTLHYGDRSAYINGIDALIAEPLLTMAQEFDRDLTWLDWKERHYSLRVEWKYVNGPAQRMPACTPGTRDDNNHGKKPADFLRLGNELIKSRRDLGIGRLLPDSHAFLTLNEILALRLYSGPAFQPINQRPAPQGAGAAS